MRAPEFEDGVWWMVETIRKAVYSRLNYGQLVLASDSVSAVEANLYRWVTLDSWHLNDMLRTAALRAMAEFGDRMPVLEFHLDFSDQPNYYNREEGEPTVKGPPYLSILAKFAPSSHHSGDKVCVVYQAHSVYAGHAYIELCESMQGRRKIERTWWYRAKKLLGFHRKDWA